MLTGSDQPLSRAYDVALLDLDGVVYIGGRAVPGAVEALGEATRDGIRPVFVTNNAARTPEEVAQQLAGLGLTATEDDVVTSAQAAARVLRERGHASVFVLGGEGLIAAVSEAGIRSVPDPGEADAVVTGYGPDVVWKDLMRGAVAIKAGVPWVASNTDLTIPTDYGVAPGHGAQVRMLAEFAGVSPVVAGKPEPPLLRTAIERSGARRPLMVGDRLDTDIEGAQRAGVDSLLVLTGVTGLEQLVAARPDQRPTFVAGDLTGLLKPHGVPERTGPAWSLGGWSAKASQGVLTIEGSGGPDDWWRVAATAAWHWLDQHDDPADASGLTIPSGEARAR